jgi:hypothetical protein
MTQVKTIRDDDNDRWRVRARASPCPSSWSQGGGNAAVEDHGGEEGLAKSDVELDDEEDGTQKPSRTAKNADLAEWIVANATKDDGSDYTAEELAGLTKANLLAIIDSLE